MKKIMEDFRAFSEERATGEDSSDIDAYRISALLVVARRMDRKKADILSDIRAVEGITTISVHGQRASETLDFSEVSVKIDTSPMSVGSVSQAFSNIKRNILMIKGVQSFKIVSTPEVV